MLEVIRYSCAFPTIREDGKLFEGVLLPKGKKCQQCESRSCRAFLQRQGATAELEHFVYEFNFSVVAIPTLSGTLLVNGIFVPNLNTYMGTESRKANRQRKVTLDTLTGYCQAIRKSEPNLLQAIDQRTTQVVSGIHDIRTAVSLLYRNAEAIVRDLPGESMEEKIAESPAELKRLLFSVRLLKSRLDMASIVNNPDSAMFGQRRSAPVDKIFHRMVRLFEAEAAQRQVSIRMRGASYRSPMLYDSFETIPLVLLDNAVKYASANSEVVMSVEDRQGYCSVTVDSYGELVSSDDWAFADFRASQAARSAHFFRVWTISRRSA